MSDDRVVLKPLNGTGVEYELSTQEAIAIGRDPNCHIVLAATQYNMVSGRHAEVRPLPLWPGGQPAWELCDLGSTNGTYLNGQRLQGSQRLQPGDRIMLGQQGAAFIFEVTPAPTQLQGSTPDPITATFTKLFPIVSTGTELTRKAYLIPGSLTVGVVVFLFITVGEPVLFNRALAIYIAGMAYYFVYQLCGKRKPWWVLLSAGLATILILLSPLLSGFLLVFREILPGQIPTEGEFISLGNLLLRMFFGAGLMEELLKALPVFAAYFIGRGLYSPWRERIGVWEPLDGILLGTASAVGFTLFETLGQYVPEVVQQSGSEAGLQLLIPRILGSVAGHMAYSGYLGYFIGLSVLIPSKRWRTLAVGYLTASVLHALWNAVGSFHVGLLVGVGVASYAFLAAAILKARALSPTRSHNFATRLFDRR